MKLKIELLSDLCISSAERLQQKEVTADDYGIPYIPAKRIKGCIREAALEMQEMGIITEEQFAQLFGENGNRRAMFHLSNAYIERYEEVLSDLKQYRDIELTSRQNVLEQYTYIRTQAEINHKSGIADQKKYRKIRVIKKGTIFEADCELLQHNLEQVLTNAASLVKHIGTARTRGLGLVNFTMMQDDKRSIKHVLISKDELGNRNRLQYKIYLRSPMICKSEQGDPSVTQDYISGAKVLGLIAGALGSDAYQRMMENEDVVVTNAYYFDKERYYPGRLSLMRESSMCYDEHGKIVLKDMLYASDTKICSLTAAGIEYMNAHNETTKVRTTISCHHQRPKDKSIGAVSGKQDGSGFYQLCSISEGQTFCGYIYANKQNAQNIIDAIGSLGEIRMGYGRSSEYGAVDFLIDDVIQITDSPRKEQDIVLTFVSDTVLYNEMGMPAPDISTLKTYLENVLNDCDLEFKRTFLEYTTIGGYNVTWQCSKPAMRVIKRGSTVWLHSDQGIDCSNLEHCFIGERIAEGYGEIRIDVPEKTGEITVQRVHKLLGRDEKTELTTDIMERLLHTEAERQMHKRIRVGMAELLKRSFYHYNRETLYAAVSKLKVIVRTEDNYESLLEDIDGLEDRKKKQICRSIVRKMNPEIITREIHDQVENIYHVKFTLRWNAKECYWMVYNSCIMELKYLIRTAMGDHL